MPFVLHPESGCFCFSNQETPQTDALPNWGWPITPQFTAPKTSRDWCMLNSSFICYPVNQVHLSNHQRNLSLFLPRIQIYHPWSRCLCSCPEAKRVFEPRLLLEDHCDPNPGAGRVRVDPWPIWMISEGIYPLVIEQFAMENHRFQWVNQRPKWAIFKSKLVCLPEGKLLTNRKWWIEA